MGDLAGDKGERSLDETEQRTIRRSVWIIRVVVERHSRVGDEIEGGTVRKANAARRIRSGLDHVTLVDRVADVKRDGNAVAHDVDDADHLLDLPDGIARRGRRRLSVLSRSLRTGEQIDEIRR